MIRNGISFEPWMCSWAKASQAQSFPMRFWKKWDETYRKEPMLHLFCGSCEDGHTRVDIREDSAANLVGDYAKLNYDQIYESAFADPPYTEEFAVEWNMPYPKPAHILKKMKDACVPGAIIGVLHLQVIRPIKGLKKVAWHPVFCGTTKHLRCLSVFQKEE